MILTEYKDYEINVSQVGFFSAEGIDGYYVTLDEIKQKIDQETKIKYKKLDGLVVDHSGNFKEVFITSKANTTSSGIQYHWVSYKQHKQREKTFRVALDTEEVRKLLQEAQKLNIQITELMEKRNELITSALNVEKVFKQIN